MTRLRREALRVREVRRRPDQDRAAASRGSLSLASSAPLPAASRDPAPCDRLAACAPRARARAAPPRRACLDFGELALIEVDVHQALQGGERVGMIDADGRFWPSNDCRMSGAASSKRFCDMETKARLLMALSVLWCCSPKVVRMPAMTSW